ncbi:hypothetical protein EUX98_g276 [Antrodiella citrinella]|uniref:Aprataxin C2HE/C2H2/C2HC zinc finger domain-containing protein n=1 Tax=Antrodiella citrinella TaxID=2447956 RepID=A0A4S4N4A5_9APHY|nr:hypothetical protein EUX98_g276 [Antrodiella citrinella]
MINSAQLTILRSYARKPNPPVDLPESILFDHSDKTLTIFDTYPKSIFHFLILPRISAYTGDGYTERDLTSLRTLLKGGQEKAGRVIRDLEEAAKVCVAQVEEEMVARYKFKWDIWVGFHPVPSMEHIHLHVISADMVSSSMKNKKHYNSFIPKGDFFLTLKDVSEWLEAQPSFFRKMAELKSSEYEPRLKAELACFHENCYELFKTMPQLKAHLQEEWDKRMAREKAKRERLEKLKRKSGSKKAASPSASGTTADNSQASTSTLTAEDLVELEGSQKKRRKTDESDVE